MQRGHNQERVAILIDGSNFYHRLKEIFRDKRSLLDFHYNDFGKWLAGSGMVVEKKYYIGVIRTKPDDKRGQELRRNQQRLFSLLRKDGWVISYGYILESDDGMHEKGVDVQIAVDLLVGAYENKYDTAILVSSDTDLLPAITKVRSMRKKIAYIGFSQKPSYALITHSDIRRLLVKEDLDHFFPFEVKTKNPRG